MKIFHALYYNGISYGIPEGTKVPEKPFPKSQCYHPDCDPPKYCNCDEQAKQYADDLQALLSVSIQWEDQEAMMVMIEKNTHPTHYTKVEEGGIYPLLGVEAEKVLQYLNETEKQWMDVPKSVGAIEPYIKIKNVLRLIPQPNSEEPYAIKMANRILENSAHSYTEGSDVLPPKHDGSLCGNFPRVKKIDEYKDWGAGNPTINKFLFDNHMHEGGELVYSEATMLKVIEMVRAEAGSLKDALRNLTEATEDKNGQFSAWHRHLREMTKAAKELIK